MYLNLAGRKFVAEWIPIDMNCEKLLPKDRPYELIEAVLYIQLAYEKRYNVTIYGLSERWQWSRTRVANLIRNVGAKIKYYGSKTGRIEPALPIPGELVVFRLPHEMRQMATVNNKTREPKPNGSQKQNARKTLSLSLRYDIMRRDGFQCTICSASGKNARIQIDHIIPVSKGGSNEESNLRVLCFECNHGKSDKVEQ